MITVFTPTYNRGKLLNKLWECLEKQEFKDFEWVVVDDGSKDDTESIMHDIQKKASFSIIYRKKENEGKHIAINEGCKLASGEWFFIVDSDDLLTPNSLLLVNDYCSQIKDDDSFAGVAGLCGNKKGDVWTGYLKNNPKKDNGSNDYLYKQYIDADFIEYKYHIKAEGDRAEVVRTELFLEHPFPKFDHENFLVESYFWIQTALDGYKFRWFNDVIYIAEYRDDGLTRNIVEINKKNPVGAYTVENLRLKCRGVSAQNRIKSIYNYYRYGALANESFCSLWKKCNNKILSPVGMILALLRP